MRRRWAYAAVAAACAAAGFGLGPVLVRPRHAAQRPAVAWSGEGDYEGYRRPARRDERWRENRGHAFSLKDREETVESEDPRWLRIYAGVPRLRPQPGGCLECHAAEGAARRGSYYERRLGEQRALGCGDCHEGQSARLGITRPALGYGKSGTQQELRALVCAQCHTEYYFENGLVKRPWSQGLALEGMEAHYDALGYRDWEHAETGAAVIKVRHPQFEMWSQGIHARSGVTCADCHMPAVRRGGMRATDHRAARAPAAAGQACGACHAASGEEMKARAAAIQERTDRMMSRAADALVALLDEIRRTGGGNAAALAMQRKAQLRLDFVRADGSRGFHAPQEALRLLAEAIDYARQGQVAAAQPWRTNGNVAPTSQISAVGRRNGPLAADGPRK